MKTIKDILYNKNDFVIVLVILLLAGFLIFNRISAINAYPASLLAHSQEDPLINNDPDRVTINEGEETPPLEEVEMYAVYIDVGESLESIGEKFVSIDLFPSVEDFVNLAIDMDITTEIKAGNFIMPSNSSPEEIMSIIIKPGL